jgi:uncharacterized membrane protein
VGVFPAGDSLAVVLIFVVLAMAALLRPINYAYWAGCVTAALALLYGYFGEDGISLLVGRCMVANAVIVRSKWVSVPLEPSTMRLRILPMSFLRGLRP